MLVSSASKGVVRTGDLEEESASRLPLLLLPRASVAHEMVRLWRGGLVEVAVAVAATDELLFVLALEGKTELSITHCSCRGGGGSLDLLPWSSPCMIHSGVLEGGGEWARNSLLYVLD